MTTTSSVGASSPDGRMFRLDLGGDDGYAVGDFVTIADDSGARYLGLIETLDQATGGGVATGSMLPGWRGATSSRPFRTATAVRSDPRDLSDYYRDSAAVLGLGSMVSAPDVEVGMSRSGSTGIPSGAGKAGRARRSRSVSPWSRSSSTRGCQSSSSTPTETSCG